MLKKIAAEMNFRMGRRSGDVSQLQRAAKQNFHSSRAATALADLGVPDQVCLLLLLNLSALRSAANKRPLDPNIKAILQLAAAHLEESRSQFFQDIGAFHFTNQKHNGYFVEVGTGSGEQISNTFMLEKHFGWNGLLFEPDRRFHKSIANCRSAILDRRAAHSSDGLSLSFLEAEGNGEFSSLEEFNGSAGKGRNGSTYLTETITLNSALHEHGAPASIDYISIDTEGSELEVLKGLDLDRYQVRFFTIEHNLDMSKKQAIIDHLRPWGYEEVCSAMSHIDVWLRRRDD